MLEREREPGPDLLDPGLEVAALHPRDALQAEDARTQVDPLGPRGLLAGELRELQGLGVAAGALQVARRRQALGGGLAGEAVGGEGVGRDARAASARSRSPCSS